MDTTVLNLASDDILMGQEEVTLFAIDFDSVAAGFPNVNVTPSSVSSSLMQMAVINHASQESLSSYGKNLDGFDSTHQTMYKTIAKSFFGDSEKNSDGKIYCCGNNVSSATAANIIYLGFAKEMILDNIYYSGALFSISGGGGSMTGAVTLSSSIASKSNVINLINQNAVVMGKIILDAGVAILYGYDTADTANPVHKIVSRNDDYASVASLFNNDSPSGDDILLKSFHINSTRKQYKNIYYLDMPFEQYNQSNNPTWPTNVDILNNPRTFVAYIGLYGMEEFEGTDGSMAARLVLYAVAGLGYPYKKTPRTRPSFTIEVNI